MSHKENSPLARVVRIISLFDNSWRDMRVSVASLLSLQPSRRESASSESVHKWSGASPASRSNRKKRLSTLAQYTATACVVSLGGAKFQHSRRVKSARATERQLKFQLQRVYLWAIQHNSRKPHWATKIHNAVYLRWRKIECVESALCHTRTFTRHKEHATRVAIRK